jgi:hypothetical protein
MAACSVGQSFGLEATAALAVGVLSTRAIAKVTGASQRTIARDVEPNGSKSEPNGSPPVMQMHLKTMQMHQTNPRRWGTCTGKWGKCPTQGDGREQGHYSQGYWWRRCAKSRRRCAAPRRLSIPMGCPQSGAARGHWVRLPLEERRAPVGLVRVRPAEEHLLGPQGRGRPWF